MQFDARIDGNVIHCCLVPDCALTTPVFCFSAMAPAISGDGYARLKSVGGYTEIQLPSLAADSEFSFSVRFENPDFAPANRAWLPLGPYLRCGDKTYPVPAPDPAGVKQGAITYKEGRTPDLLICPQPTQFTPFEGFVAIEGVRSDAPEMHRVSDLTTRLSFRGFLSDHGSPLITTVDPSLPAESYRLEIRATDIQLISADSQGTLYGGITLATLIETHGGVVPCGMIEDAPRFSWRGQHLDCGRHFYEVETILRLLDLMAMIKLNRFHWHFADDEAFRLQLDTLPELAQTHFRGEGELVPGVFGGGRRAGGCYSKADAKRVVDHAKALGIEVMPEIETPAHAFALCQLFPETRDRKENSAEQSVQGYFENVMNPAMPESWRVWESMIDEVAAIFPFNVLHLGGDELPHDTWQGSPAAKELMCAEGLGSTQDLQGWTMNKLAQRTVSKGKIPAGWEESALGVPSIGNGALIFSWTGQGPGLQAARDGHQVVMMPGQKAYLDMAQSGSLDDWGANWAAIIPLEETINWDPVPDDEPELESHILGVEGAFWSEFTTKDQQMEAMLAPRILGIAMMGWQDKSSVNVDTLLGMRSVYARLFDQMGWTQS